MRPAADFYTMCAWLPGPLPLTFMTYILIFLLSSLGGNIRNTAFWAVVSGQNKGCRGDNNPPKGGPLSPEGTQERNKDDLPTAEVHIKGVIPISPDIYSFP